MKNSILIFIIICMCFASIAQDYKLTFSGKESSNVVDSVLVKNLTQGTSIKLGGKDTLILVKETTGISNISKKTITEMEVYPNPFSNECALSLYTPTNENICLQVIDISGKMLISQNRFIEKGNHIFKLSGIPRGMHLVRILSSNYSATQKIISTKTESVNPNI